MADIQYKGESLELSRDSRITLESSSGYFDMDIVTEYSLPVELPYTDSPLNRRILQGLDIPTAIFNVDSVDVFFEFSGRYYVAKMVFRELDDFLTVNLYFGKNELTCMGKYCNEISIPNSKSLTDLYNDGILETWPNTKAYFPMLVNPSFYDDVDTDPTEKVNPTFENVLNAYDTLTSIYRVNYLDGSDNVNVNTLVPQVALMELLKVAFEHDGYSIKGSFVDNLNERRLFIGSNLSLDSRASPSIYEDVEATGTRWYRLIQGNGLANLSYENVTTAAIDSDGKYHSDEEGKFIFSFECETLNISSYVFFQLIFQDGFTRTVIKEYYHDDSRYTAGFKIEKEVDISAANGNLNKLFYVRIRVTTAILGTHRVDNYKFKVKKKNQPLLVPANPSDLGVFLPKVKFADFLKDLVNGKILRFDFNREKREVALHYKTDVFTDTRNQDLSDYLLEGSPVTFEERKAYLVKYNPREEAEKNRAISIYKRYLTVSKEGEIEFYSGEAELADHEEIRLNTNPMMAQSFSQSPYTDGFESLLHQIRGISPALETEGEPMERLRLGYYVGFVDGLPVASNTNNEDSLEVISDIKSVGGRWALWLSQLNVDNRIFKRRFLMPRPILDELDLGEPIIIRNQRFVVKKMTSTVNDGDLQEVELYLRKL